MIFAVTFMIIVQGWTSVIPKFSVVDFFSYYLEILVMIFMFTLWFFIRRFGTNSGGPLATDAPNRPLWQLDFVDTDTVDLYQDEYIEEADDKVDDEQREHRIKGRLGYLWRLYYWIV